MPFIDTKNDFPGIVGLMYFKPSTGKALSNLAQALLRGPSPLSTGERELIATHVSRLNQCEFCSNSHSAVASELMGGVPPITPKLQALLELATKVQQGGRSVTPADIQNARQHGASDEDIHDTVAVASAFCLFNRYVDGLGTATPQNHAWYQESGAFLAKAGYKAPSFIGRFFMKRMQKKYSSPNKGGL